MSASTTKKRSTSRKKTTRGKKTANKKISYLWEEIVLLTILAFSILMMISNFGMGGAFGQQVHKILFGLFGSMAYAFPVVLFIGSAFAISNKFNAIAWMKVIAGIIGFLTCCAFFQMPLISNGNTLTGKAFYELSAAGKNGGGIFGGLLAQLLNSTFGTIGAYVVLVIFIIICIVLITEHSFFRGVKKGSTKVYETAKVENQKRRERMEIRNKDRLSKVEQRWNKKASGVAMDTALVSQKKKKKEMQEILPEEVAMDIPIQKSNGFSSQELDENKVEMSVKESNKKKPGKNKRKGEMTELSNLAMGADDMADEEVLLSSAEASAVDFSKDENFVFGESIPAPPSNYGRLPKSVEEDHVVKSNESLDMPKKNIQEKNFSREIYHFPSIELLKKGNKKKTGDSEAYLRETAVKLQKTLQNFGVKVTITNVSCGPSVTRYELAPEQGVKVSKIVGLTDDIKLNLAAADIRVEAPIPGKAAVGIEVPNQETSAVLLRDLLESSEFKKHPSDIAFAVGKDISGETIVTDIAKMPHLLIAGATGSGKSVCINTLIMSILYKADPADVKLIMVDPKVVELSVYNGIPHLFIPVVTDPKKAAGALNWAVSEMTDRYKKFADYNVRDLKGYNEKIKTIDDIDEEGKPEKLPQIVIIVDELADLMMVAPGEVEDAICRLAQMARAAGLHLVIATQRPSVNVITGLIKANVPSRIAFSVSSGVDSRTIIDMNGAEKLLGKGDMLFYPSGYQKPVRIQGAFVSDKEVSSVVEFLAKQNSIVPYNSDIEEKITNTGGNGDAQVQQGTQDVLFIEAGKFIIEKDKASIGMLQRMFKIGFNRAARVMDQLSEAGVVGEEEGTKPRKVLMTMEQFESYSAGK